MPDTYFINSISAAQYSLKSQDQFLELAADLWLIKIMTSSLKKLS